MQLLTPSLGAPLAPQFVAADEVGRPATVPVPAVIDEETFLRASPFCLPEPAAAGREEFANAASHAIGVVMACAALPLLAVDASAGDPARLAGVVIFASTMLLVFLASSIFHALPVGRAKALLRRVDHAAIFLFIAGSFTPFALAARSPGQGLGLLAAIWGVAAVGVGLKLSDRLRRRSLSTLLYLVFGWLAVAAAEPALQALGASSLRLLMIGGAAYHVGCLFYLLDRRLPYAHLVWHLCVLVGSAAHILALMHGSAA